MKIIYLDKPSYLPDSAVDRLASLGDLTVYDDIPDEEEAVRRLNEADVAIVEWSEISAAMLDRVSRLKYIVLVTTGYDFVNVEAAKSRGIYVSNTPQYSRQSVAEHVFALTFAVGKQLCLADSLCRSRPGSAAYTDHVIGLELYGKTLGIWGLGSIGSWVARLGNGFGMHVVGCSRSPKALPDVTELPLDKVLQQSDIFSICVSINPSTRGVLDANKLSLLKNDAILVNIAENAVLDETGLAILLNSGRLRAAAFDSTPSKSNPLLQARNTFFTPGTAWYTQSSLDRNVEMFIGTVETCVNEKPRYVVNP